MHKGGGLTHAGRGCTEVGGACFNFFVLSWITSVRWFRRADNWVHFCAARRLSDVPLCFKWWVPIKCLAVPIIPNRGWVLWAPKTKGLAEVGCNFYVWVDVDVCVCLIDISVYSSAVLTLEPVTAIVGNPYLVYSLIKAEQVKEMPIQFTVLVLVMYALHCTARTLLKQNGRCLSFVFITDWSPSECTVIVEDIIIKTANL